MLSALGRWVVLAGAVMLTWALFSFLTDVPGTAADGLALACILTTGLVIGDCWKKLRQR